RIAPCHCILVLAIADRLHRGLHNRRMRVEIRVALAQIHRAVRHDVARHLANDRFLKLLHTYGWTHSDSYSLRPWAESASRNRRALSTVRSTEPGCSSLTGP